MELRVTKTNRIFADGKHNAFPGAVFFKGAYYISFRSGSDHISFDGSITVIRSEDLKNWEVSAEIHMDSIDLRDTAMIAHDGRILLYTGYRAENLKKRQTAIYSSCDGVSFKKEKDCDALCDYWLWSVVFFNGEFYAAAYTICDDYFYRHKASVFKSANGVDFDLLCEIPAPGGEPSIDMSPDGTMHVLVRNDKNGSFPHLAKAKAPYNEFYSCEVVPVNLQGFILKRMKDSYVIIGRTWDYPGRRNLRTAIYVLEDNKLLRNINVLPSGGDTSYAAWIDTEPGKAILAYYSAHEYCMDCEFDQDLKNDPAAAEHNSGADIYLASLCYKES
jgi:hypothetical protein